MTNVAGLWRVGINKNLKLPVLVWILFKIITPSLQPKELCAVFIIISGVENAALPNFDTITSLIIITLSLSYFMEFSSIIITVKAQKNPLAFEGGM